MKIDNIELFLKTCKNRTYLFFNIKSKKKRKNPSFDALVLSDAHRILLIIQYFLSWNCIFKGAQSVGWEPKHKLLFVRKRKRVFKLGRNRGVRLQAGHVGARFLCNTLSKLQSKILISVEKAPLPQLWSSFLLQMRRLLFSYS